MAERRGGYQPPRNPASFSGVGSRSRRTDGRVQPQRVPNIQESTDLQQGERRVLEQGQRIAPLSRVPAPRVQPPGIMSGQAPTGSLETLLGLATNRPNEPETTGLPFGPGGGPEVLSTFEPTDEIDVVLQGMMEITGDQSIALMLQEHQEFKAWQAQKQATPTPASAPVTPEVAPEPDEETLVEEPFALPEPQAEEGGDLESPSSVTSEEGLQRPSGGPEPPLQSATTPLPQP